MASILTDDKQFHLKTRTGEVGEYVILCGDPGRVPKIAAYFDDAKHIATNREYVTYTGTLDGVKVSSASTGIGGPSAAICVEELIKCGAKTFIRVGTCGGMNLNVQGGDLIVAMSAVRDEGTSAEYMPISYPATASFAVCTALAQQAEAMSVPYHVGVVQSKDSFYGETNPETMPISEKLLARWEAHMKLGCLASEMECAAIFSVCATRNARASAVLLAIWNVEREKQGLESIISMDTESAIKCAVGAIRNLIAHDSKQLTIENGKLTIAEKQNQTRPSLPNSSNNGVFM